jgi:hypothetical protein
MPSNLRVHEKMLTNLLNRFMMVLGIVLILASLTKALPERRAGFSSNARRAAPALVCGDCFDTSFFCDCGTWNVKRIYCGTCCYHPVADGCVKCYYEEGICICGTGDCSCGCFYCGRSIVFGGCGLGSCFVNCS